MRARYGGKTHGHTHTKRSDEAHFVQPKKQLPPEKKKKRNSGRRRKMEGIEEISMPKENQSAHS